MASWTVVGAVMETIPPHTCIDHVVPCCRANDLASLSATSRNILHFLREVGAFEALHRQHIAPLNDGTVFEEIASSSTKAKQSAAGPEDAPAPFENIVRACAPAVRFLNASLNIAAESNEWKHSYSLNDVGGRPRHPKQQCLPSQGGVRALTGMHISGKRLIALASQEDQYNGAVPIRVWLQSENSPSSKNGSASLISRNLISWRCIGACSGSNGQQKKRKKKKKNGNSGGSAGTGGADSGTCCAVCASSDNSDLVVAVFRPSSGVFTRSIRLFDLCEDLNVPVSTLTFSIPTKFLHPNPVVHLNFAAASSKIVYREGFQFHVFDIKEEGTTGTRSLHSVSVIGNGLPCDIEAFNNADSKFGGWAHTTYGPAWANYNLTWNRHSMCRQGTVDLAVGFTAGGKPPNFNNADAQSDVDEGAAEIESRMLHVWNTSTGEDYFIGDEQFRHHLHSLLQTDDGKLPSKGEIDGDTNSGHEHQATEAAEGTTANGGAQREVREDAEVEAQMAALRAMNLYDGSDSASQASESTTHRVSQQVASPPMDDAAVERHDLEEIPTRPGSCLMTCCGDRVFCVHSKEEPGAIGGGIGESILTVVSAWRLASRGGSKKSGLVGYGRTVVRRREVPFDMAVVTSNSACDFERGCVLFVCDRYECVLYEIATSSMLAAARFRWNSAPLAGRTLLLSGLYANDLNKSAEEEVGKDDESSISSSKNARVSPFVLAEVRRSGLVGYGPGIEPPWAPVDLKVQRKKEGRNNGLSQLVDQEEEEAGGRKKKKKKRQQKNKAKGVKVRMRCGGGR